MHNVLLSSERGGRLNVGELVIVSKYIQGASEGSELRPCKWKLFVLFAILI
jgi:hypothetical protein